MAKQLTRGESISEDKKAAIKADYEVGLATKSNIAKKHRINRTTLYKLAKKEKWVYAIGNRKATESITKKVTKRIVEDELFLYPNNKTLKNNLKKINIGIKCIKKGDKVYFKEVTTSSQLVDNF